MTRRQELHILINHLSKKVSKGFPIYENDSDEIIHTVIIVEEETKAALKEYILELKQLKK